MKKILIVVSSVFLLASCVAKPTTAEEFEGVLLKEDYIESSSIEDFYYLIDKTSDISFDHSFFTNNGAYAYSEYELLGNNFHYYKVFIVNQKENYFDLEVDLSPEDGDECEVRMSIEPFEVVSKTDDFELCTDKAVDDLYLAFELLLQDYGLTFEEYTQLFN